MIYTQQDSINIMKDMVVSIVKFGDDTKKEDYKDVVLTPLNTLYPNYIVSVH